MGVGEPGHGSSRRRCGSALAVEAEQAADRDVESAPDELVGEPDVVGVEPAGRVDDQQRRVRRRSRTAPDAEQDRVRASGGARVNHCIPLSATPAGRATSARSGGTVSGAVTVGSGSGAVVATDWRFEGAAVESRALPEPHRRRHDDEQQAGHHADTTPPRTRVSR